MATDFSIIENDLKNFCTKLKRDLHMREVRKLARKHHGVSKKAIQNKQIIQLKRQFMELEPTVSRLYSTQHHLRDNQIKGYLIYLLQMEEYFDREVKTKMGIIQKRNQQIKSLVVRLCLMRNEYTNKLRCLPRKPPEFILLENMSNRMNQIEKRVSVVQSQNKELRKNILDTVSFLRQYKKFEKDNLSKVKHMTNVVQEHLDNAVAIYEERENFVNKTKIYQDHFSQDVRKAHLNENSLNLLLEKTKKFEDFGKLQNKERVDSRIAVTGDLIEKGVTGLEPILRKDEETYMEIARASGRRTPQQMREIFGLAEDKGSTMFTHLENLLEEINHTQNTVNELKEENRNLLKSISTSERKLKWEISEKQAKMGLCKTEAERAEVYMNSERTELNNLYESLWRIHKMCGLGDTEFEDGINDFNAETIKEEVEKQIIEYLMQIEYFRMKKALIEKKSQVPLQKEVIDPHSPTLGKDTEETEVLDTLQPRTLESEAELSSLNYLQQTESVLPLERLKQTAMAAVAEMESTEDSEEDDESK